MQKEKQKQKHWSECIPVLIKGIKVIKARNEQDKVTRHVAAIMLRKRISGHLRRFDGLTKSALKSKLLSILRTETLRPVNGIVALVASVCKLEAKGKGDKTQAAAGWPELF